LYQDLPGCSKILRIYKKRLFLCKEMLLKIFHSGSCSSFAVTLLITVGACHSEQKTTGEQSFQLAASPCAISMSTPSIQMGEGRPLNFFPTETLKFRRAQLRRSRVSLPSRSIQFSLSTAFACCASAESGLLGNCKRGGDRWLQLL
jgi:hypothetical protein